MPVMIIIDGKEVGIELIDQTDPKKFNMGILLRDEKACKVMKICGMMHI